jgi:predicted aminopeptidase
MTHILRSPAFLTLFLALTGCASPTYYLHALSGQMDILAKRRPVEEVLNDPATTPQTKQQLELVLRLREFASRELLLPDNRSYRRYADLERPFAVWNVFATPELSLEPKQWCFIVAGCVPYRGYFARDQAEQFAARMKQQGADVYLGGVPAYSTLGWFDDPLLNTFITRSEAELAGLLFHELAHQKLYVNGDTPFNESFATLVELEGVKRWLQQSGKAKATNDYMEKIKRREEFSALVLKHRARLKEIYASNNNDAEKRMAKTRVFEELQSDYASLKTKWNGYAAFDKWFAQDLNNAHLAAIGLYSQYVAAFQELLVQQGGDLAGFYRAVENTARLPKPERAAAFKILGATENFIDQ